MHLAEFPTRQSDTRSIVIDCSKWNETAAGEGGSLDTLLQWVRSLSGGASVHVYIRSQLSGQIPRRYQAQLQSVGCTVTARAYC